MDGIGIDAIRPLARARFRPQSPLVTPKRPSLFRPQFRYLTEFQSHEPEFDYLKSLEIEEKINKVRWGRGVSHGKLVLSTNDKTIKLWRVYEKTVAQLTDFNVPRPAGMGGGFGGGRPVASTSGALRVPRITGRETMLTSKCRKTYSNGHAYHINSISPSSDGETFISADDLRINMWHFEVRRLPLAAATPTHPPTRADLLPPSPFPRSTPISRSTSLTSSRATWRT